MDCCKELSCFNFYVVEFCLESSVSAVPCNWIPVESIVLDEVDDEVKYGKCWWPPVRSISRLAKIRETPNEKTWTLYDVKLVKAYDSYEKARIKSIKYEVDSELNTESEKEAKRKRFGNAKYGGSTMHSSDESDNGQAHKKVGLPPKFPKRPAAGTGKSSSQAVQSRLFGSQLPNHSQVQQLSENAFHPHPTYAPIQRMESRSPLSYSGILNVEDPGETPHSSYRVFENVNLASESCTPKQPRTPHCCSQNAGFQRKVLTLLEDLKRDVAVLMRDGKANARAVQLPSQCPALPLQDVEDITLMEHLLNDPDFFRSVDSFLAVIGGVSVKDCTKRILGRMISASLSAKYNWKGSRGTKLPFCQLSNILRLIPSAVRATQPSATESEVAAILKTWLMHAADRDGSRSKS